MPRIVTKLGESLDSLSSASLSTSSPMAAHHCVGSGLDKRRNWLSAEAKAELEAVVSHIGQPGKGISACDESGRTINPRFAKVRDKPSDKRRAHRESLSEAPDTSNLV